MIHSRYRCRCRYKSRHTYGRSLRAHTDRICTSMQYTCTDTQRNHAYIHDPRTHTHKHNHTHTHGLRHTHTSYTFAHAYANSYGVPMSVYLHMHLHSHPSPRFCVPHSGMFGQSENGRVDESVDWRVPAELKMARAMSRTC